MRSTELGRSEKPVQKFKQNYRKGACEEEEEEEEKKKRGEREGE